MKAEFIINLSFETKHFGDYASYSTSQYTHIYLPTPSSDELEAITFLSSEKNKQSDEAYSMHRNNLEQYMRRTEKF